MNTKDRIEALILCGGRALRMEGLKKADLVLNGRTFLEIIMTELQKEAGHIMLSIGRSPSGKEEETPLIEKNNETITEAEEGIEEIYDPIPDIGPMGGLYGGLLHMKKEFLLVAPVDMPLLRIEVYRQLLTAVQGFDCAIPIFKGQLYPLTGVYRKSMLKAIESSIQSKQYRVRAALAQARVQYVDIEDLQDAASMMRNINTKEAYGDLLTEGKIIAVSGVKNSGKTTLLCELIKELRSRNKHVAVIKHDAHEFKCDIPGTDSDRLSASGAFGTAVIGPGHLFINRYSEDINNSISDAKVRELSRFFSASDIIFVEGMKQSRFPKIEVVRKGVSSHPVSNPEGLFLIVTDIKELSILKEGSVEAEKREGRDIPCLPFEEIGKIADMVLNVMMNRTKHLQS